MADEPATLYNFEEKDSKAGHNMPERVFNDVTFVDEMDFEESVNLK